MTTLISYRSCNFSSLCFFSFHFCRSLTSILFRLGAQSLLKFWTSSRAVQNRYAIKLNQNILRRFACNFTMHICSCFLPGLFSSFLIKLFCFECYFSRLIYDFAVHISVFFSDWSYFQQLFASFCLGVEIIYLKHYYIGVTISCSSSEAS